MGVEQRELQRGQTLSLKKKGNRGFAGEERQMNRGEAPVVRLQFQRRSPGQLLVRLRSQQVTLDSDSINTLTFGMLSCAR